MYSALCEKAGHTGPLHRCSLYGSKEAGTALRSVGLLHGPANQRGRLPKGVGRGVPVMGGGGSKQLKIPPGDPWGWVGLGYWGLTPQQQPGSYQGGEMVMKSVFWRRKPEYPEETTDLRQVGLTV